MPQSTVNRNLNIVVLALFSATLAIAQSASTTGPIKIHGRNSTWQVAQVVGTSMHKLVVITVDQPNRRQACRVRSFTADGLVCSRVIGAPRVYLPQQVLALIVRGDGHSRIPIWLALNVGSGAAIWGTLVLTATCPACAAATALAALVLFGAAGAIAYADDVPDRILYLAPGHALSGKIGYVQDWP